jgi:hypothetical protein
MVNWCTDGIVHYDCLTKSIFYHTNLYIFPTYKIFELVVVRSLLFYNFLVSALTNAIIQTEHISKLLSPSAPQLK